MVMVILLNMICALIWKLSRIIFLIRYKRINKIYISINLDNKWTFKEFEQCKWDFYEQMAIIYSCNKSTKKDRDIKSIRCKAANKMIALSINYNAMSKIAFKEEWSRELPRRLKLPIM